MKKINLLAIGLLLLALQTINAQDSYTSTKTFGADNVPIRELRTMGITGNMGWNGLTGFGISLNSFITGNMEIDAGVGLSSTGFKFGARYNYLFSMKKFSPFVAAGFMYGTGSGAELKSPSTGNNSFNYIIKASPFAQIVGGFEYMSKGGFLLKADAGYAILLVDNNYEISSGSPGSDDLRAMDMAFGSGIVLELSIGYAWGGK
ncbi:MAG: hypothetical protein GXO88_09480 [Chlorobi bacterium]|nr:hypothetical protein [Chlorobiota bacterium]